MKICVLDIGGTYMKGAVMNENADILERMKTPSDCSGLDALMESLDKLITPVVDQVEGIAVSMPGTIDCVNGIAETGGAFMFVKDWPVVSVLEEKYHLPVTVENDGKAAAGAENWKGALKDVENGLVFIFGTGIGGGVILHNQVFKGSHYSAGELSVCLINHETKKPDWSNFMALRSSTKALLLDYMERTGTQDEVDGVEFFKRANAGEEAALETLRSFCRVTANYFFSLQAVLDVERIAIGGGISEQPLLLQFLNEELDQLYLPQMPLPCRRPQLVRCRFGNDANLIGALKVFLDFRKGETKI